MMRIGTILRRPATLLVTIVAISDLAYRRLLRPSLRRGLGIDD